MARTYKAVYTGTYTNAGGNTDLMSIQPADDKPCRVIGWILGQTSELSDAAEESLRITFARFTGAFTIGSGGSSVTPAVARTGDTAAGATVRANDTTVTTSGTKEIIEELSWNIRNTPWERYIPEELRTTGIQAEALVLVGESTPTDDITFTLTVFFEEL